MVDTKKWARQAYEIYSAMMEKKSQIGEKLQKWDDLGPDTKDAIEGTLALIMVTAMLDIRLEAINSND